ncbi:MAG: peptidoglycan bridge formation glycyltransferase FemA/FemB family protein [Bacteroidota bacterium]
MPIFNLNGFKDHALSSFFPFAFTKEYAEFVKSFYGNDILYFEFNNGFVPFEIIGQSIFKQVKVIGTPYKNGIPLQGEELKTFLNAFILELKKQTDFIRVIQPHPMAFTTELPTNSTWCEFGTYITALKNKSDDELLDCFDSKYKKAVLHSIKNNGSVTIHPTALIDFYDVYENTCKRAKIYCDSIDYFKNIIDHLPQNTMVATISEENGNTIGAAFFIFDQQVCYCTHAGSVAGSKLYGGMKHLHFEVMKWMRNQGVENYDLTGVRINSTNETLQGIFKFKKGFGGELKQGYLWKVDLKKTKCLIYDLLLRIKMKGKLPKDIIDQEN